MKKIDVPNCIYCIKHDTLSILNLEEFFMNRFKKTVSAVLAAAVIFGTAAIPAYADSVKKIDGVLYRLNDDMVSVGEYSGWVKQNGKRVRYQDGLPYTGWLKNKDGSRKYCMDGYLVTGDIQMIGEKNGIRTNDKIYTFDENGILTGKRKADIVFYGNFPVDAGDGVLYIMVTAVDGEFSISSPQGLERWENGEWVSCDDKDDPWQFTTEEIPLFDYDGCEPFPTYEFDFPVRDYLGGEIDAGHYRLVFTVSDEIKNESFKAYYLFYV